MCLLRDGAHGSTQGGISGDKDFGAVGCLFNWYGVTDC